MPVSSRKRLALTVGSRLLLLLAACLILARHAASSEECAERGLDLQHPAVKAWHPPGEPGNLYQQCVSYRDVCFDQGTVVSFDPAHSPANASHVRLPRLDISKLSYTWGGREGVLDSTLPTAHATYAPLEFRPASTFEGAPDLQRPAFSNCTIPLVMWLLGAAHSYDEFVLRTVPRLWALQRGGALSNRTTLVIGGPAGERLPHFAPAVLKPFTPFDVVSFSEFSQRNPPADGPRTTAEQQPHRCFRSAYLCLFLGGHGPGLFGGGQAVARHYTATSRPPLNPLGFDAGPEVLRVLIDSRSSPVHSLLNAEELAAACKQQSASWTSPAWQREAASASPIRRLQCRAYSFGHDTAADVVAATSSDVIVAVHGAGCTNWFYMPPGSALLELRPFEFGSKAWPDLHFPAMGGSMQHKLHWYGLNVEDPALSVPAAVEAVQPWRGGEMPLMQDRHVTLPLPALREMLLRIAAAGRSHDHYKAQRQAGTFYAALHPGGLLKPVQLRRPADPKPVAAGQAAQRTGQGAPVANGPARLPAERSQEGEPQQEQEQQPQLQCAERGLDLQHPAVKAWRPQEFGKPWGQHCLEYRKVCFDQGAVISFDPSHSPANASSVPLPRVDVSILTYIWAGREGINGDVNAGSSAMYAPLEFRPASALEGAPDLQRPAFSNCTVPLVMWSLWSAHNYLEFFVRTAARVWVLQRDGALSNRTTLVIGGPAGERLPGFAPAVLEPLTPFDVVSFSEFSQRNPPSDGPRTTAEGKPHRCFEKAYLCAFQGPYGHGIAGMGQTLARHHTARLPPNPLHFDAGPEVLRVLIDRRSGPMRNLLNAEELAADCNKQSAGWQYDPASPVRRIQCRTYSFGHDTAADVVAAASSDVIVAVHGAGCTNWFYMPPGSALLELRPYQFGTFGWADAYFPLIGHTTNHTMHWYGVNVESPLAWKPGPVEVAHPERKRDSHVMRDRHVILPPSALQEMLLRIAAAGRSQDRYLAQRQAGRHYVEMQQGGLLQPKCGKQPNAACAMTPVRPQPVYVPEAAREAATAAAAARPQPAAGQPEAATTAALQPHLPAAGLRPRAVLREKPSMLALLSAAILLLAAAAVGRSVHSGANRRRQPPTVVANQPKGDEPFDNHLPI